MDPITRHAGEINESLQINLDRLGVLEESGLLYTQRSPEPGQVLHCFYIWFIAVEQIDCCFLPF